MQSLYSLIFFNYKYQNLTPAQKVLGMGYSTFMNGSIVLEQDFKQQVYTLGYAGVMLCCVPWLLVALFGLSRRRRGPPHPTATDSPGSSAGSRRPG